MLLYGFTFFILLNMTGCKKQEIQEIDDARYIVDLQMILILCEDPEAGTEYADALKGLKGNGDEVLASIKLLKGLEQTVAVKNAIGVANNLLRKPYEAESYFQDALLETKNSTDRAILLSNLAEAKYYQKQHAKQFDIAASLINEAVEEYQKVNTDRVLRMTLESNQLRLNMMMVKSSQQSIVKYVSRIKEILKEERKQFGANQFIGMYNFQSMGLACHYDQVSEKRKLAYMEKSLDINKRFYNYVFFDINMYNLISDMYYQNGSFEKNVEYRNKCIELMDEWQSKWHYNRLQAYVKRIESNYMAGELDKLLEDCQVVLEQSEEDTDLVAISYFYLGQIYLMQEKEPKESLDCFLRAFCIWYEYDRPDELQMIKTSIQNIYRRYEYEKENPDFENWFDEKIKTMHEELQK